MNTEDPQNNPTPENQDDQNQRPAPAGGTPPVNPTPPPADAGSQPPPTPAQPEAYMLNGGNTAGGTQDFQNRIDLTELSNAVQKIEQEARKIIVGQNSMIELLIASILANGHVLIEGVPGVAKTLTAKILSKVISVGFSRIQFTPDLMPSDVLGTNVYNFKNSTFEFSKGPIFSNIILIDEINRAPAKTQAALFEVMEERQVTMDSTTYIMDPPFIVFATQNPIEQEGTYRLPEAQLDRFIFKIEVNYPSMEEEVAILSGFHESKNMVDLDKIQPVISREDLIKYQDLTRQVRAEHNLLKYIAAIVEHTRNNRDIFLGGSTRASLSILSGAKAIAAIRGRDFITPDDIKTVVKPVLRHRIMLTPEKEMEGGTTNKVIDQLVHSLEVPR